MALFLILPIILEFALSNSIPGPKLSMEKMMKKFSEIEYKNSVSLNSSNLHSALTNNSDPWFIFFSEPRAKQSIIKNPVWSIFSTRSKEKKLGINSGFVNMAKEKDLLIKFKVFTFPNFIYLEEGFAYNFTGTIESDNLEKVVTDKLYLQYDRKRFELDESQTSQLLAFRTQFLKNPALFISAIFLTSTLGLSSFSYLFCRGKKIENSKTQEPPKKSKKRE